MAEALGITQPSVSDAKRRNVFLPRWCAKLSVAYNIDTDSLLYGTQAEVPKIAGRVNSGTEASETEDENNRLRKELVLAQNKIIALLEAKLDSNCKIENSDKGASSLSKQFNQTKKEG